MVRYKDSTWDVSRFLIGTVAVLLAVILQQFIWQCFSQTYTHSSWYEKSHTQTPGPVLWRYYIALPDPSLHRLWEREAERKTERDRMLPVYSPWSALSSFVSQRWTKNGSVQPSLALQRWNSSWQPVSHLHVCGSAWKSQTIINDFIMKACVSADCEEKWGTLPLVLSQTHTHIRCRQWNYDFQSVTCAHMYASSHSLKWALKG